MKIKKTMTILGLSIFSILTFSACQSKLKSQNSKQQTIGQEAMQNLSTAEQWYASNSWKNGFKPDGYAQMDIEQFYDQYMKNKPMYDSIFSWLSTIDAVNMPAGKSVMTWSHALANIQDLELRTPDKCKIEQHRKHIDLQWDVTGSEQYGLVRDTTQLEAINKYKYDVQNFKSNSDFLKINSDPNHFFLFFPSDYHQACGIANKPETVRKVVVKIEYFE